MDSIPLFNTFSIKKGSLGDFSIDNCITHNRDEDLFQFFEEEE